MKILVTGAKGFVGKNLCAELKGQGVHEVLEYDRDSTPEELESHAKECEFVFHLAGVNRPQNADEYMEGNHDFTQTLLESLKKHKNKSPVLASSSTQAELDNPYGKSKKAMEDLMFSYAEESGVKVFVYRLTNVFGKWCKPNYNSAVATFCYAIANELPMHINDPKTLVNLVYIDDVVSEFMNAIENKENRQDDFCYVKEVYKVTLGEVAELIRSFKTIRRTLEIPNMADPFTKKLYSTYLSYLPVDNFSYPLKMNTDKRGSFTEFVKTESFGQVSVNIFKPGIKKGNHWHHTKNEKFLVVSGEGIIRFRELDSDEMIEYHVSAESLEAVDIPTGYVHSIINTGKTDMVTVIWANESFDPDHPDTYFEEV